jgi:hypothetical protein
MWPRLSLDPDMQQRCILRGSVPDPGFGILCLIDPCIRDPGWVINQIPDHISESVETMF